MVRTGVMPLQPQHQKGNVSFAAADLPLTAAAFFLLPPEGGGLPHAFAKCAELCKNLQMHEWADKVEINTLTDALNGIACSD
ncbi:MAG TPA: hypothetical protein VGK80_09065 [Rhodanobacteraceae bacterium]